jgi:hypothetical protein
MNKETNSNALDIVTHNIVVAIDSVGAVLSLLDECGLDKYDYELVKDGMLSCLLELNLAYDVVALADDEGEQP